MTIMPNVSNPSISATSTHISPIIYPKRHAMQPISSSVGYATTQVSRCGTPRLCMAKFTILKKPSPRMKPCHLLATPYSRKRQRAQGLTEASTINGVSCHPIIDRHHQLSRPPIVRASVNEGTLYMPTATAMPPGISGCQRFPDVWVFTAVVMAKRTAAPSAHSLAIGGSPLPVTRRAVKIQT